MRVAITGVTGVLGRHLLFEFVKQNLPDLDSLELIVLGRRDGTSGTRQRVVDILLDDGSCYISAARVAASGVADYAVSGIRGLDMDLDAPGLGLDADALACLRSSPIDLFIHSAALTDLRPSEAAAAALRRTNVDGTRKVLKLVESLDVREFCYVGSAYCAGTATGLIAPDFVSTDHGFRNPYEESKMRAEIEVRRFAARTGVRCRYFRPSIISGRLIEPPLGAISKFNVFYGLGAFLLRTKTSLLPAGADVYGEPLSMELRACCCRACGLNIVPADYVAKAIYHVCAQGDPGESYHIVNEAETPIRLLVLLMLGALNIRGFTVVDEVPVDKTRLESIYYKTVGAILTPYAQRHSARFDTANLQGVLRRANLHCPPVDRANLSALIEYAKTRMFGLGNARAQGPGRRPVLARANRAG